MSRICSITALIPKQTLVTRQTQNCQLTQKIIPLVDNPRRLLNKLTLRDVKQKWSSRTESRDKPASSWNGGWRGYRGSHCSEWNWEENVSYGTWRHHDNMMCSLSFKLTSGRWFYKMLMINKIPLLFSYSATVKLDVNKQTEKLKNKEKHEW